MSTIRIEPAGVVTVALACAAPLVVFASVNSLVPAGTGGFGEMTCHQCHSTGPLNDPSGRLALDGVPASYTSGQRYLITVTVAHPQLVRAGFQLAANAANGDGLPRGDFIYTASARLPPATAPR